MRLLILLGSLRPSEPLAATLEFLEWGRRPANLVLPEVVALEDGAWAERVAEVSALSVVQGAQGIRPARWAQRAGSQRLARAIRSADLRRRLTAKDAVVYVADPRGARLLHWLGSGRRRVVAHLHAFGPGLTGLDAVDRKALIEQTDRWIVGSPARERELEAACLPRERARLLPDLLAAEAADEFPTQAVTRSILADEHGVPSTASLVCSQGCIDWWSVPDAFVRVAWELVRRRPDGELHALWLADGATERMLWPLRHDIRHAGLESRVHVVGPTPTPVACIAASDVFLSTRLGGEGPSGQREAVMLRRPVVWFQNETAAPQLDDHQGVGVPYLDVDAMVEAVLSLLDDPVLRARHGQGPDHDDRWHPPVGGPLLLEALTSA